MVGVALDRPPQPAAYPLGVEQVATKIEVLDRVTKGLVQGGRVQPIAGIQSPSNASGPGLGHMARECPTSALALNHPRGNQGNVTYSLQATATLANSRLLAFQPQPWTKTSQHEGSPMNWPMRSHPSHSIFKSTPHCPPSWMI